MKAMILAAGLGTRLQPLTNSRPKALVEVGGIPLLEFAIRRLSSFGVREMIINVHHFADQIESFLVEKDFFGLDIQISDERDQLLETGGALKKAAWFFADGAPFLLYNADIVTDLDLALFQNFHLKTQGLVTLAVRRRRTSRYFRFDSNMKLHGWVNHQTGEERWCRPGQTTFSELAFSGIHCIDPELFAFFPPKEAFSIVEVYLKACAAGPILGYNHSAGEWVDAGRPEHLEEAGRLAQKMLKE